MPTFTSFFASGDEVSNINVDWVWETLNHAEHDAIAIHIKGTDESQLTIHTNPAGLARLHFQLDSMLSQIEQEEQERLAYDRSLVEDLAVEEHLLGDYQTEGV